MTHKPGAAVSQVIRRLVLLLVLIVAGEPLLARARLVKKVVPVSYLGGHDGISKLIVYMPCGAQFRGLVLNEKGATLALGAMLDLAKMGCTSIPKAKVLKISSIDFKKYKSIYPMRLGDLKGRFDLSEVQQVQAVGESKVQLSYVDDCSQVFGYFLEQSISEAGGESLGLAVVKYSPKKKKKRCASVAGVAQLNFFDRSATSKIMPLILSSKELEQQYRLKLAAPDVVPLRRNSAGELLLSYKRGCKDSPFALITRQRGSRVELGILVAEYYNMNHRCVAPKKTDFVRVDSLIEWPLQKISMINKKPVIMKNYRIKTPIRVDVLSANQDRFKTVRVDYVKKCAISRYSVISLNSHNPSIGVLEQLNGEGCLQSLKYATMHINYLSVADADTIYPMVLKKTPTPI